MATSQSARTERPRFYEQQYLGASDLTSVVEYSRAARARHDLGAHVWGIAAGLQIVEQPSKCGGPLEVYLEPGYAWDGFGRPITVLAPVRIPAAMFGSLTYEASDGNNPPGRLVPLWIRYSESAVGGPPPGFEICSGADQYSRTWENYQLVTGARDLHTDRHDAVTVASYTVDAREVPAALGIPGPVVAGVTTAPTLEDESVPFQRFSEGDARWYVPLGVIRWLPPNGGAPGAFQTRVESTDPDPTVGPRDLTSHERARRYIGVVAGTVNAAGAAIRMRSRDNRFDPVVWSPELVWIEGSTRVEGDVTLLDGKIAFRDGKYDDHKAPLTISCNETNALGGRDLVEQIGAGTTGVNRLVVGPKVGTAAAVTEMLVVKDNGMVGVGEPNPDRPLVVRARGSGEETIGLQTTAGTTKWAIALKTNAIAGLHIREVLPDATRVFVKEGGDVGIGTTAPTQNLHVQGNRGIRQNELYLSGGDGNRWSSLTFNAYHNQANTAWEFPNQGRPAVTVEMDDATGIPRFEVWSTSTTAPIAWVRRLAIDGNVGTTLLAPNGGNVGVGTGTPLNRLHVDGGTGLRVGRLHMSGGGGGITGSSVSFNAFRNVANSAWEFPDAARTAVTIEMDDALGTPRFEVWSTTAGAKSAFQQRLRIDGESGDFVVAHTGGKAGIGTPAPVCKLHVAGSTAGDERDITQHVAIIENTANNSEADVLALRINRGSILQPVVNNLADRSNNFITFFAGPKDIGSVEANQYGFGVIFNSISADVAEWMPRMDGESPMIPGDVVGVYGGRVSRQLDGAERIMVVSTAPALLGNRPPDDQRSRFERIAFIGSAPVRVFGPVKRGDFLIAAADGDNGAVAVSPQNLTLQDVARVAAMAWEDAPATGVHSVRAGIGLPPGSQVWSLVAAEIGRLSGESVRGEARAAAKPRVRKKSRT